MSYPTCQILKPNLGAIAMTKQTLPRTPTTLMLRVEPALARLVLMVAFSIQCCHANNSAAANQATLNSDALASASPLSNLMRAWTRARTSGKAGCSLWSYEGFLYDPLQSRPVARVQGLEIVQPIQAKESNGLAIDETLAQTPPEFATTWLSRKLFCYLPVQEKDEKSNAQDDHNPNVLRRWQFPRGPVRHIPTEQCVATYDTATTCMVHGDQVLLHTEFPNGRTVWSPLQLGGQSKNGVEFTVMVRPSQRRPDFKQSSSSIPRSSWIDFGTSKATNSWGTARETYSYQWNDHNCTVQYTRYGEGPPWYGPQRACTWQLTGRRVASWHDLAATAAQVAATCTTPAFMSAYPMSSSSDLIASWRQRRIQAILPDDNQAPPHRTRASPLHSNVPSAPSKLQRKLYSAADRVWTRIRAATTLVSST
jgi:hypothetical protein